MARRRRDVAWQQVGDQLIGLNLDSSRYFSLNSTAARLWELLESDVEEESLVEALVSDHAVDPEVARRDVEAFLLALRSENLLEE